MQWIFSGLAHADDVVILGRAVTYVTETVGDMTNVATQLGLIINTIKTKYMINRKDNGNEPKEIEISGQKYEKVEMFKYLGSLVTNLNDIEIEIETRLTVGNKCYHALGQWFPNGVSRHPGVSGGTTRCVAKLKKIYLN
jgi:hypothetical protein